jgi:hypothetical protein
LRHPFIGLTLSPGDGKGESILLGLIESKLLQLSWFWETPLLFALLEKLHCNSSLPSTLPTGPPAGGVFPVSGPKCPLFVASLTVLCGEMKETVDRRMGRRAKTSSVVWSCEHYRRRNRRGEFLHRRSGPRCWRKISTSRQVHSKPN